MRVEARINTPVCTLTMQMLRRADYLDLPDTVQAALHKLAALGAGVLTLNHATELCELPDFQCGAERGAGDGACGDGDLSAGGPGAGDAAESYDGQVRDLVDNTLQSHFPSAHGIMRDQALLANFAAMPLVLLERWVELDR